MTPIIDMKTGATVTEAETIINANDVGELKGLLSSAREQGLSAAIIKIPARLLTIDEAYQTPIRTNRDLSYLINNFDDRKLLPLVVVPHDEEGRGYMVDGCGRWKATRILDEKREKEGLPRKYDKLECMVILNAPTEPKERRKFEAEEYAFQNKFVKKVSPLQKHGAFECLEDKAALIINELKEKYQFEFVLDKGNRHKGVLGSYSELFNICTVHGKECAEFIFEVCERAGFNIKCNGYSTYVMRALRDIWKYYPNKRKETTDYLAKWLREREPAQFKANAVARYGMLDCKTACSLYLEDLLVDNIGLSHVRYVDGKSVAILSKTA